MKERFLPRKPVILSESTQRRLRMYALAASASGVSLLALEPPAEARIVYTPTHVKLSRTPFPIDLNKDGIDDFFLIQYPWHGSSKIGLSACQYVSPGYWGPFCYQKIGANAIRATKSNKWAAALRSGATIKAGDRFNGGDAGLGWVVYFGTTYWSGPWMNGGKGVKNRYLGLKFKAKGHFHFGWARITVKTTPRHGVTAVLTGYAYETIPGKAIVAGKTKGSDVITQPVDTEAGTLGHLALGRK
ncbi:MAG TPA: hypothetical protein VNZ03_17155 [Terriglobales bacterium]|jgi:hypothetical protein|nr:hypothetical protein [Terriglobales bacterium]